MIRTVALFLLALACTGCAVVATDSGDDWRLYKELYISAEGRVIDNGNANVTHSEGQGFGLLLAVHNNDRAAFDNIWSWTRLNLQVRDDKLLAWKWNPGDGGGSVPDKNNATDGDVLVAWALYRASRRWSDDTALQAAREISRDIRAKLVKQSSHGIVLLPGEQGFVKPDGITVNLSYWVFPAFRDLDQLDPAPEWKQLTENGLNLLRIARFGRWQLPSDWLLLGDQGETQLASGFEPRFGYNAMRIPLYLIWAKLDSAENLKAFNDFWGYFRDPRLVPAWTSLRNDSVDSHNAAEGTQAIASLARQRAATGAERTKISIPKLGRGQDYYSASLLLLAHMAALESAAQ